MRAHRPGSWLGVDLTQMVQMRGVLKGFLAEVWAGEGETPSTSDCSKPGHPQEKGMSLQNPGESWAGGGVRELLGGSAFSLLGPSTARGGQWSWGQERAQHRGQWGWGQERTLHGGIVGSSCISCL